MERRFTRILIAGLAAFAVGCGGGSGVSQPAAGPVQSGAVAPVAISGTLGGTPGALTFNRQPVSVGTARVTAQGTPASASKLQPGVVITGTAAKSASGYELQSADLHHEIEGAIERVNMAGSTFVVMGQSILVNALTKIEADGPGDTYTSLTLADLKVGDRVEVYGSASLEGTVTASRVERESSSSSTSPESLHGMVSKLDATAKTFEVDGYAVSYGTATITGTLANGVRVEVSGTKSGMTISATSVKVETSYGSTTAPSGELEVCGTISHLDTTAKTFQILTYKVDYSAAKVVGTLAEGAKVEVEGTLGMGEAPVLKAQHVEVEFAYTGSGSSDSETTGFVTALSAMDKTLTVGTTTYWTDAATLLMKSDSPASFSDLKVGDKVEVYYMNSKTNTVGQKYAAKVEILKS